MIDEFHDYIFFLNRDYVGNDLHGFSSSQKVLSAEQIFGHPFCIKRITLGTRKAFFQDTLTEDHGYSKETESGYESAPAVLKGLNVTTDGSSSFYNMSMC